MYVRLKKIIIAKNSTKKLICDSALMCETNHRETWAMVAFPDEFLSFRDGLNDDLTLVQREEKIAKFIKETTEKNMSSEKNMPSPVEKEVQDLPSSSFSQIMRFEKLEYRKSDREKSIISAMMY